MRLIFKNGIFVAIAEIDQREALKSAGFSWHPGPEECKTGMPNCRACKAGLKKAWWSWRHAAAARLSAYADDSAKAALLTHVKAVEMSRATDAEIDIPAPRGLKYLGYQKAGILYLSKREGTLLGDEQGIGKTIEILGLINLDKTINNVLVICPATLRINWKREATKWLVRDERHWVIHIVNEDEPIPPQANFVIVHYNRITVGYKSCKGPCAGQKRAPLTCPKCKGTGNGPKHPILCDFCKGTKHVFCPDCKGKGRIAATNLKILGSIQARQWDLLCADEAHYLKNVDAKRTLAVLGNRYKKRSGLADLAKRKIYMTGTPIPNRPIEIWPIIASLAPMEFGNFKSFARRYAAGHEEFVGKSKKIFKFDGASNLEELQERLRSVCMIRRLKVDVLKELPPKRRQIIPLTPSDEAKKLIAEEMDVWEKKFGDDLALVEAALDIAEQNNDNNAYTQAVDKLKYIQRVAFIEMAKVRRQVAVVKIPAVIEHIEGLFEEGVNKLVCYGHHHEVIEKITEHFEKSAVAVYGSTEMNDRQQAIDKFQDPRSHVKLFVGGIMAAGTGLTLTAASTVVFAELDWTPGVIVQCEDRLHRIGQMNSVLVQHLVLDGSLDARMAQMIVEKQEIADRALDKSTDVSIKGVVAPRFESPPEPVPLWKKIALKEALIGLAMRRDPAYDDGHGFNTFDATIGQSLATSKGTLSDKQAHVAFKLASKYRRQIPESLARQLEIYEPPPPPKSLRISRRREREEKEQLSILDRLNAPSPSNNPSNKVA